MMDINLGGMVEAYLVYVSQLFLKYFLFGSIPVLIVCSFFYLVLKSQRLTLRISLIILSLTILGGVVGDLRLIWLNQAERTRLIENTRQYSRKMADNYRLINIKQSPSDPNQVDITFSIPRTTTYSYYVLGKVKGSNGIEQTVFSSTNHKAQLVQGVNTIQVGKVNQLSSFKVQPLSTVKEVDVCFALKPVESKDNLDNTPKSPYFGTQFRSLVEGIEYGNCNACVMFQECVNHEESNLLHLNINSE